MERLWEGKDVKAKIIFIKYEKKVQFWLTSHDYIGIRTVQEE